MPRKVNYGVDYDEDDYDDGYEDYDYDYDVQENCKLLLFSVMSFECSLSMGITFHLEHSLLRSLLCFDSKFNAQRFCS